MSLLKDNHIYSYSQLSSVSECPFGFYLQRIERAEQQSNGFAEQGTLIHDLLDQWAKGELTKEQLPEEYARRYPEEVVTKFPRMLTAKGYAEKAYNLGIEYFENFDEFAGYTIISAEEKFETEIDGRPFIGIIDMILKDDLTDELIVLDHKSKSLTAFKKSEDEMYRQQLLYAKYVHEKYGQWPDRLMFNLFKEGGKKMERRFRITDYDAAMLWARQQIEKIEEYDVLDWLECKEPDFFCNEICSVRKHCPNGIAKPKPSTKKK